MRYINSLPLPLPLLGVTVSCISISTFSNFQVAGCLTQKRIEERCFQLRFYPPLLPVSLLVTPEPKILRTLFEYRSR